MYSRTFRFAPLGRALARARTHRIKEDDAKAAICGAIADEKIRLSARVWLSNQWILIDHIEAPKDLQPDDLDWDNSCVRPQIAWTGWWDREPERKYSFLGARIMVDLDDLETVLAVDTLAQPPGGRPPKYDWEAYREAFKREVKIRGLPERNGGADGWRTQADVVKWVEDLIETEPGYERLPDKSMIKKHVRNWIREQMAHN
jgi:hypothetical protein